MSQSKSKSKSKNTVDFASAVQINVLVVIDTEYVKTHYPNPSTDPANPTGIDHKSQFMICTDPRGVISGQGTADLNFTANPGDLVSFVGQSIYANSDDAVILYGIKKNDSIQPSDTVFNPFVVNVVKRTGAVVPNTNSPSGNGLPATQMPVNFITLDSKIAGAGTEAFLVQFGLYTLDANGENQNLFGYYEWDPTVTVP